MENKKYTAKEAAKVLRKQPREINYRVKKGGIKEIYVEETDEGFQYMLSEKSIEQLGALFGIAPDYSLLEQQEPTEMPPTKKTRAQEMIEITGPSLSKELKAKGISSQTVSRAIGAGDTYIHDCIRRNRISKANAEKIEHIFGISTNKYIAEEQPKVPATTQQNSAVDTEAIRSAVYNGMIDALLMFVKENTVRTMIIRLFQDQEFINSCQKIMYQSIKGAIVSIDKDTQRSTSEGMNAGLIPQNGVRR